MARIHHEYRRRHNPDEWQKTKTRGTGDGSEDELGRRERWIAVQEF